MSINDNDDDAEMPFRVLEELRKVSRSLETEFEPSSQRKKIASEVQKRIKEGEFKIKSMKGDSKTKKYTLELSNWGYKNERKLIEIKNQLLKLKHAENPEQALAENIVKFSSEQTSFGQNGKKICKLKTTTEFSNDDFKVRRMVVESKSDRQKRETKMVLLVGSTGSGKTSLVNNIVNYVYGVSLEDDFRLKLIEEMDEEEEKDDRGGGLLGGTWAKSMTSWVSGYELRWQEGFRCPWNLYLVDTPGFGDDKGLEHDDFTMTQIQTFLDRNETCIVDDLASVALVIPSSTTQLTKENEYVLNETLNLFAKNLEHNVSPIFTFTEDFELPAIEMLTRTKIECAKNFKIDNSAVYECKDNSSAELAWKLSFLSFRAYFEHLEGLIPVSLKDSRFALHERDRLHFVLEDVRKQIQKMTEHLMTMEKILDHVEDTIDASLESDEFRIRTPSQRHVISEVERMALNCNICKHTCQRRVLWFVPIRFHAAFNRKGKCRVCDKKCDKKHHVIEPKIYAPVTGEELLLGEQLYQQYRQSDTEEISKQVLLERMEKEYRNMKDDLQYNIARVSIIFRNLEQVAMRNENVSELEHIQHLISQELKSDQSEAAREEQLKWLRMQEEVLKCAYVLKGQNIMDTAELRELETRVCDKLKGKAKNSCAPEDENGFVVLDEPK